MYCKSPLTSFPQLPHQWQLHFTNGSMKAPLTDHSHLNRRDNTIHTIRLFSFFKNKNFILCKVCIGLFHDPCAESLHRSLAGTQNEPCGLLRAPPVFTKEECYYCSYGAAVNNAGSTATGSAV